MSQDNISISLSDIGRTLCEIEKEIDQKQGAIRYYEREVIEIQDKIVALKQLAADLLKIANPKIWNS